MNSTSIIIFGIVSLLMLILSCISLNASKFYNELEVTSYGSLGTKPTIVLRDRSVSDLELSN